MSLCNVEFDFPLIALVASTVKISLTILSNSDTNTFWDASFIPSYFPSTIWVKVFSWLSNLILCRSLPKNEDVCWSLKSSSGNAFKSNISIFWRVSIWVFCWNLLWILFQFLDKKMDIFLNFRYKFNRSFFFLIMNQNFSFSR